MSATADGLAPEGASQTKNLKLIRTNSWGYLRNGSFDGLVGELQRGRADLGGSPLFMRADRARHVDYTAQTWNSRDDIKYSSLLSNYFTRLAATCINMQHAPTADPRICLYTTNLYPKIQIRARVSGSAPKVYQRDPITETQLPVRPRASRNYRFEQLRSSHISLASLTSITLFMQARRLRVLKIWPFLISRQYGLRNIL
ncbi:hypothetical protein EVAR_82940_1 [Eumeta japonica]|uniref:Uncharacterized protein n=1 Tax=Eumeta variegata TaxID=151549 RepID=A0A4C1X0F2_EUMVA|nr:hypothetical protein EVAR_82940_1 [Eumeta japonica]